MPFRLDMSIPDFAGVGATDPSVCALLAAEVGERFEVDGDSLWLTVRPWAARDPLLSPLARAIRFEDVTFRYGDNRPALRDLTLTIPAGAQILRLLPPLNLSQPDAEEGVNLIESVVKRLSA